MAELAHSTPPCRRAFVRTLIGAPLAALAAAPLAANAGPGLPANPLLTTMRERLRVALVQWHAARSHLDSIVPCASGWDQAVAETGAAWDCAAAALAHIVHLRSTDPRVMNLKAEAYAAVCGSGRAVDHEIDSAVEDHGLDAEALAASIARDIVDMALGPNWSVPAV